MAQDAITVTAPEHTSIEPTDNNTNTGGENGGNHGGELEG
jgi:hypothetical protein